MVWDVVCDTLFEEGLAATLAALGKGRLVMDKDDPEVPYLTPEDGYLIVRLRDGDPIAFARELERRTTALRIVTIVNRTPDEEPSRAKVVPLPGSFGAQRSGGLL